MVTNDKFELKPEYVEKDGIIYYKYLVYENGQFEERLAPIGKGKLDKDSRMEQVVKENFPSLLDQWARKNAVGYYLCFCEADGSYSVEIISACEQERFFRKRVNTFQVFKLCYEDDTGLKGMFDDQTPSINETEN